MTAEQIRTQLAQVDWAKRSRQVRAVFSAELRRSLWSSRSWAMYFVALAPAFIVFLHGLESPGGRHCNLVMDTNVLGGIVEVFYARVGIFFGCLGVFTWMFRGEIVQRSLHYYFLTPMPRWVLVLGKFFAGLATTFTLFGSGVLLSYFFMYGHFGAAGQKYMFEGAGPGQLVAYLTIVALACIGYGSIFMALSLVFRNPAVPGAMVFFWESINGVLPAFLQKFSITFYLKNLAPIDLPPDGIMALFTVVANPVPKAVAILGLLALSGVVLVLASWRIRGMEISYSRE